MLIKYLFNNITHVFQLITPWNIEIHNKCACQYYQNKIEAQYRLIYTLHNKLKYLLQIYFNP